MHKVNLANSSKSIFEFLFFPVITDFFCQKNLCDSFIRQNNVVNFLKKVAYVLLNLCYNIKFYVYCIMLLFYVIILLFMLLYYVLFYNQNGNRVEIESGSMSSVFSP